MGRTRGEAKPRPGIGLALAGGGPEGAVYEIGALCALDEAIEGIDSSRLGVYVGVSAGSFIAACLANGITSTQLARATLEHDGHRLAFSPQIFFRPAMREWIGRALVTPRLVYEALVEYAGSPRDQRLLESFTRLTRALPVGLFDNEPIRTYLAQIFEAGEGRTDDFRELPTRLFVIASDLDSGQAVRFGEPGLDAVPISLAVQASTALPGLYPPVEIDGRHYVDGVLLKTLHASVALEAGAELLFCINPIVPVDTRDAVAAGSMSPARLIDRGLPTVLSQTFRTLVHSRLRTGIAAYAQRYPRASLVLLEPDPHDYRMFFTNVFKFSDRRAVCEHGYSSTRAQLRRRHEELAPLLARHGLALRTDVLEQERTLADVIGPADGARQRTRGKVTDDLDRTLTRLEALLAKRG